MRTAALLLCLLLGGLAHAQDSPAFNGNPFFLIELTPVRGMATVTSPTAAEQKFLGEHIAYMHLLVQDKMLLVAGPSVTASDAVSILIVQAPSSDAAQRILNNDPSVKGGVFKGEVRPFRLEFYRK